MSVDWFVSTDDAVTTRKPKRSWAEKFAEALRGVKLGVRGQASFAVHFFFATFAILAGVLLECDRVDWCLIVLCIGVVISAELFNTALETLFHGLDDDVKQRLSGVLDIAAGAVLIVSLSAGVVGTIVFTRRMLILTGYVE